MEIVVQVFVDLIFGREDDIVEVMVLVVDMFCGGIDDDMGVEVQWMLEEWCCKYVVDYEFCVDLIGEFGDIGNIDNFQCWVGWVFQEYDFGVWLDCFFLVGEIVVIDQCVVDVVFGGQCFDDIVVRFEEGVGSYDVIVGFQLVENGG